jgi:hypothetical protein
MEFSSKNKIVLIGLAAVAVYAFVFAFQRNERKKSNEKTVSYDEALKILEENK